MIEHNCHWIEGVNEPNKCMVCNKIIYTRKEAESFGWVKVKKVTTKKSEIGRKARASGKLFELKVRHEMEDRGLIVCKWSNQIDFEKNKIIPAKSKFNPFTKVSTQGSGFPDFVVYSKPYDYNDDVMIIGVESKKSKYLDKTEKSMCDWLIKNSIFHKIFIAYKGKDGIIYKDYFNENEFDEITEGMRYERK